MTTLGGLQSSLFTKNHRFTLKTLIFCQKTIATFVWKKVVFIDNLSLKKLTSIREYGEEKNNDRTETKTYKVSQLVNVSSTRKGMKKWNIHVNVTCYQPAREVNGIRWNGWRLFV
jgi:hypothetical protein